MAVVEVIPHIVVIPHVETIPHVAPVEPRVTEPAPRRPIPVVAVPHSVPSMSTGVATAATAESSPSVPVFAIAITVTVLIIAYLVYRSAHRAKPR